jgi:hypothetical protein
MIMRLPTTFVALALVAASACGGDGTTPQAAPTRDITVERAIRVARAGVLRAADLPGWKHEAGEGEGTGISGDGLSCLRLEDHLGEHDASFARGRVLLASWAGTAETAAVTAREIAFVRSAEFRECFERVVNAILAEDRLAVVTYASRPAVITVRHADDVTAVSIRMTLEKLGAKVPARAWFLGASTGHATLFLLVLGVKAETPSLARLTALLTKAVARARAAEREPGAL